MTKTTNDKLGKALARGIEKGEGVPELRKRVKDLFKDMATYRATRIARTETTKATNWAAETAYKESGVVKAKEWLVTADDRLCEFCRPMNGKKVKLGDTYFKEGETVDGDKGGSLELSFEDIQHPPLHANCRCTLIPIIK